MGGTITCPRVAVIGAGASGVAAAAHLLVEGIDVVVFEKARVTGGVWVFDPRRPPDPPYPNLKASACYESLRTNAPTPLIEMSLNSWSPDTELYARHSVVVDYIRQTAAKTGVDKTILHNTKVDSVTKDQETWRVRTSTWDTTAEVVSQEWGFDAVVVATGHYHAPYIPDIPGLAQWKEAWPDRVQHSKGYRSNKEFQDQVPVVWIAQWPKNDTEHCLQVVLLVGAGASAVDIASELGPCAKKIWQSTRGSTTDHPLEMLPVNATRVAEIASFGPLHSEAASSAGPIPGKITLVDGQILEGIDKVVMCTGYLFSLPFLARHHNDNLSAGEAGPDVLVTDGSQIHNLHEDIFYVPDPTLAFVGVPTDVASFSLFEFQAIAIAAVFSGQTMLPSEEDMRTQYDERVKDRGTGKRFHSLLKKDVAYAAELMEWVNRGRPPTKRKSNGYSKEWLDRRATFIQRYKGKGGHLKADSTRLRIKDTWMEETGGKSP
ncbi:hypothetical protein PV08_08779 [Exophiala spinifera]|uniref:FAD/NAD(P)-binding domain-containing protein n=1 Tax=Exophiala spinifera TaxID=91928 RepID=A0A0D2B4I5_9EURO|nr:uncharacterized protein PV08_08779 [Exophiala spinifera]KIW13590.1 hypothetical protein PV08_08779 [Exophiala spinifera]